MALPATVPLVLDLYDGSGAPIAIGRALLTPSALLTDASDRLLALQSPVTAYFSDDIPTPTVYLLPTDDSSILPSGWKWQLALSGMTNPPPLKTFSLPYSGGTTRYLSDLTLT